MKPIRNQIMLITYPDSLGGNLKALEENLEKNLSGAVGSIHILPFFPSSGDRGFAPTTYEQVEPSFGDWTEIEKLSGKYMLMCDMMVNHISRRSKEFQDYLAKGRESAYADMFFDYTAFFGGEPSTEELARLYKRSDKALYQEITLPDGEKKKLWCSFSAEQIDLDTDQAVTRDYIMRNLSGLGRHGISFVRMDAYGYITKVRGTNCFFVEPKVWELIRAMEEQLAKQDMTLLPEVHDRYETALKISAQGYYTYDFVLPLTVLHTLITGSAKNLKRWLKIAPMTQFTVLDTHDGVGVYDADGIVNEAEADDVIRYVEPRLSYAYKPMDMSRAKYRKSYQLYGTYYSMLNEDDDAMLLARAIQFFAPGIPQVYYVGMLAGRNDLDFDPADHRNINRHNYTTAEVEQEIRRPVVRKILALMRFRNTHPAFNGRPEVLESEDNILHIRRTYNEETVELKADVSARKFEITYTENGVMHQLVLR